MQRNQKTKQPWKRKIKCVITLLDFESCQDCMALAEGQTHRPKGWSLEAGAHKYSQQTEDRGVAPEQLKIHTQKGKKENSLSLNLTAYTKLIQNVSSFTCEMQNIRHLEDYVGENIPNLRHGK